MKKNTIIIAAAASVLLAGCAKEQFVAPSSSKTVISVSIDDDTKTTIGDLSEGKRPIYWANGDQICINGLVSEPLADLEAETKKADFTFNEEPSTPYNTLYPASYYNNSSTVTLPSVAGALPVPMAAQGLALKPLTGVLKITVNKGEADANIVQVQISSTTAQLSGDFTINYADGTLAGIDSSEEAKTVTLKKNRALTAETPYEVFIPVPAGSYSFSVKILDDGGNYMVKSTSAAKTVKAGQILALEAFAFNPTGTQDTDVEITSAEELVAFAKKYNAGDYEGKPWIIAKLMNDITFDAATSKALVEEGGIGVPADSSKSRYVDHYFNGTFDGQGHSIKGYVSYLSVAPESGSDSLIARPIFNYTGSDSFIRNIVIDSSCDIQLPKGGFGTLAYRVKGLVENVTCNADVAFRWIAGATNFGGIVGRVYGGTVRNCTMNGNIVCNTTNGTSKVWKIGGVVGTVEDGGTVDNCTYTGYFQWGSASAGQGPSISTDYYFGGIAGHVMDGKVLNSNVLAYSKTNDLRGKGGYPHFGGVVGCVEEGSLVSGCSNAQGWYVRLSSGFEAHMGGVVGTNNGTVTSCSYTAPSSGAITGNVGHYTLFLGGIVGNNNGEITSCTSTGCLKGPNQYSTINIVCIGGVAGKNNGAITSCFSKGSLIGPTKNATPNSTYIGGVVGWTTKGLSDLTHEGSVAQSNAATESYITTTDTGMVRAFGGVVGYAEDEIVLENLTNKGSVNFSMTTKVNDCGDMVGGVIGCINGPVIVTNCKNDGIVSNTLFNNTYSSYLKSSNLGGIVGVAVGTETKSATITKCTNNKNVCCRRGILGGICGWAKKVNITECESYGGSVGSTISGETGQLTESIAAWQGGIVGKADTLAVINGCKVENIKLCYKPATAACVTGGIAGALLTSTSQIISCTAKNVAIEPQNAEEAKLEACVYGGVAGTSVEGSWIHSCKFCGTYGIKGSDPEALLIYEICSDQNFDDDLNNELIEEE